MTTFFWWPPSLFSHHLHLPIASPAPTLLPSCGLFSSLLTDQRWWRTSFTQKWDRRCFSNNVNAHIQTATRSLVVESSIWMHSTQNHPPTEDVLGKALSLVLVSTHTMHLLLVEHFGISYRVTFLGRTKVCGSIMKCLPLLQFGWEKKGKHPSFSWWQRVYSHNVFP